MRSVLLLLLISACSCPVEVAAEGTFDGPTQGEQFSMRVIITDALAAQVRDPIEPWVVVTATDLQEGQTVQITECTESVLATGTSTDGTATMTVSGLMSGCGPAQGCEQELCVQFPDDDRARTWSASVEVLTEVCDAVSGDVIIEFDAIE